VREILTGKRLFTGEDMGDILASVVKEQPNLSAAPKRVHRLLESCLQKDPAKRLQSIGDMRLLLVEEEAPATQATSSSKLWPIAAAAGVMLGAIGLWAPWRAVPAPPEVVRFEVGPPEKGSFTNWMSLSPDGKKIGYTARGEDGQVQLWVRPLDSLEAKPITVTAASAVPFWSADSRSIAYHLNGKLRRVDAAGGPSQVLCDAPTIFMSGTWSADGTILFGGPDGIQKVSANGGVAQKVTSKDAGKQETGHDSPIFLPDGRHFLYHARASNADNAAIYVGSLDDATLKTRLMASEVNSVYAAGFLLFERERALMAQPFDAAAFKLTGEPVLLASAVGRMNGTFLNAMVAESSLIYRSSSLADVRQLTWVDREGKMQTPVTMPAAWAQVRLSSDGTRAVLRGQDAQGNSDVWMVDLKRALPTRFTFDKAIESNPVWSPDDTKVVFLSPRNGGADLYLKAANGTSNEEILLKSGENKAPTDWSKNGFLLYTMINSKTKNDVWVLPMEGDKKPRPFLVTDFDEGSARFSPDGRFVAYVSNETGNDEVYVRSFPDGGGKWQVSKGGGATPAWSRDGKQLFYTNSARLFAVDVTSTPTFQSGEPRVVYTMLDGGEWDVAPDGRFLVVQSSAQNAAAPIKVVLNWQAELKK
jgi:Tol biopolymer transport system component